MKGRCSAAELTGSFPICNRARVNRTGGRRRPINVASLACGKPERRRDVPAGDSRLAAGTSIRRRFQAAARAEDRYQPFAIMLYAGHRTTAPPVRTSDGVTPKWRRNVLMKEDRSEKPNAT